MTILRERQADGHDRHDRPRRRRRRREILTGVKVGDVVVEPTVSVTAPLVTGSATNGRSAAARSPAAAGGGLGGGALRRAARREPGAPRRGPVPVIELREIVKTYAIGDIEVHALRGVSLTVERGDFVAIMGASGSGKSTLMNIIGCLDVPTRGRYWLDGVDVRKLDETRSRGSAAARSASSSRAST